MAEERDEEDTNGAGQEIEERSEREGVKKRYIMVPPPLCKAVQCNDLDRITPEEILKELLSNGKVERVDDGIYAMPYEFKRITPSMIGDYEFCPRLLWLQTREGKKFATEKALTAMTKGQLLHERYERALSNEEGVLTEYKIEVGDIVGVIDIVMEKNGKLVPVEVKTGAAPREAHVKQLQIYIELLGAEYGYLVYRDRVEMIRANPSALSILEEIKKVLQSPKPPPLRGDCDRCPFKKICRSLSAKHENASLDL